MFDFKVSLWVFTCYWCEIFWHMQTGEVLGLRFTVLILMAPTIQKLLEQPLKRGSIG